MEGSSSARASVCMVVVVVVVCTRVLYVVLFSRRTRLRVLGDSSVRTVVLTGKMPCQRTSVVGTDAGKKVEVRKYGTQIKPRDYGFLAMMMV